MSGFWRGIIYSGVAGITTVVGAIPFLLLGRVVRQKTIDVFLGFAAGVMLAASAFSLALPSIELGGPLRFAIGFLIGGILVDVMDKLLPHEHFTKGHEGMDVKRLKTIWLFIIAITIHNFPEGMAVGVGGFTPHALTIAIAIGLQNIPEGAAVAASLMSANYKKSSIFFITLFTGLVEFVGGFLGVLLVSFAESLLPYLLALAAGAMVFVISDEVIPETHLKGAERITTYWLLIGFVLMTILDVILG